MRRALSALTAVTVLLASGAALARPPASSAFPARPGARLEPRSRPMMVVGASLVVLGVASAGYGALRLDRQEPRPFEMGLIVGGLAGIVAGGVLWSLGSQTVVVIDGRRVSLLVGPASAALAGTF